MIPDAPEPREARPGRSRQGLIVGALVVAACYVTGLAVNNLATGDAASAINRIFPRIGQGNTVDSSGVAATWRIVQQEYVLRSLSADTGTQGAETGIINLLKQDYNDRFSNYYTADQYAQLQRNLTGQRLGSIGIALEARCAGETICGQSATPTELVLEEVLHNQPAEQAGLKSGDVLVSVDGKELATLEPDVNKRLDRAASLVRGDPGTQVTIGVLRKGQPLSFTVTRKNLSIPAVYSQRFGSVLDIEVTGFDDKSGDAFRKQLQDGINGGATSVILDLRGNPGGLVSEAQSIASQFLQPIKGKQDDVVVRRGRMSTSTSNPLGEPGTAQKVEHDTILSGGVALTPKLVVLVDENSASASEIVAAALHDYNRGQLVGQKTFGKGSVQEDFPLPGGADLHLTVERWFGPNGESIDGTGITPDRPVTLADPDHRFRLDSQSADPSADAQFQAALAMLAPQPQPA
ncbi:MAG TPA: S41 family peptidase [Candidatus Angelobacter sp.]|nr:S41 family peptidase [Candidatus Angelobacter sp.]